MLRERQVTWITCWVNECVAYLCLSEENPAFPPLRERELHGFVVCHAAGGERSHVAHVHVHVGAAHEARDCGARQSARLLT